MRYICGSEDAGKSAENLHIQGIVSCVFAWRLVERLWRCDRLYIWSIESTFIGAILTHHFEICDSISHYDHIQTGLVCVLHTLSTHISPIHSHITEIHGSATAHTMKYFMKNSIFQYYTIEKPMTLWLRLANTWLNKYT